MDWMVIMNSTVYVKTLSSILLKDLKKTAICIGEFGILKTRSNKIFLSNDDNIISKAPFKDSDFKSTADTDILFNELKKDVENIKLKL